MPNANLTLKNNIFSANFNIYFNLHHFPNAILLLSYFLNSTTVQPLLRFFIRSLQTPFLPKLYPTLSFNILNSHTPNTKHSHRVRRCVLLAVQSWGHFAASVRPSDAVYNSGSRLPQRQNCSQPPPREGLVMSIPTILMVIYI